MAPGSVRLGGGLVEVMAAQPGAGSSGWCPKEGPIFLMVNIFTWFRYQDGIKRYILRSFAPNTVF